jgi:hypothetical protein
MTERLRYYFHGEAYEADTSLHYCVGCDGFERLEHFPVCSLRAKFWPRRPRSYEAAQHHQYKETQRIWRKYGRSMHEKYRVEADPLNPFLLPPAPQAE